MVMVASVCKCIKSNAHPSRNPLQTYGEHVVSARLSSVHLKQERARLWDARRRLTQPALDCRMSREPKHPLVGQHGFSLVEMLVAVMVAGVMIAGMVGGYIQTAKQAEWSAYSLAANALALQRLEQVKAAKWDPAGGVDQVVGANFPARSEILDVPVTKTNIVYATNRTTITSISTTPPLKMVRVDCTWTFLNRGVFTNSVVTYRAPDQ